MAKILTAMPEEHVSYEVVCRILVGKTEVTLVANVPSYMATDNSSFCLLLMRCAIQAACGATYTSITP